MKPNKKKKEPGALFADKERACISTQEALRVLTLLQLSCLKKRNKKPQTLNNPQNLEDGKLRGRMFIVF